MAKDTSKKVVSININTALWAKAKKRLIDTGGTFSNYVETLIAEDLKR